MPGRKRAQRKEVSPTVDTPADAAAETTTTAAAPEEAEERVAGGSRAGATQEVSAEAALGALEVAWPQRRTQARTLVAALGRTGDEGASAAALLVHGGAGTGKTAVVRDTLRVLNRPHAYASCLTCTTPGLLFEVRAFPPSPPSSRRGLLLRDGPTKTASLYTCWAHGRPLVHPSWSRRVERCWQAKGFCTRAPLQYQIYIQARQIPPRIPPAVSVSTPTYGASAPSPLPRKRQRPPAFPCRAVCMGPHRV
jgi:hypothetical protein